MTLHLDGPVTTSITCDARGRWWPSPGRRPPGAAPDDRGSASIVGIILALMVLMTVVLVVDGGQHLGATQQAHQVAAEAARAGGQSIQTGPAVRGEEAPRVDAGRAQAAAQSYLAAAGVGGDVRIIDGQRLEVTATVRYASVFGTLLNLPNVATGSADVRLVRGLDSEV